jgi:hypothetical protein
MDSKRRLFEILGKIDRSFKPNSDILNDDLSEATVKLPENIIPKIDELYEIIVRYKDLLTQNSEGRTSDTPYLNSRLLDFFKLNDLKNDPLNITIGFYNSDEDSQGVMDTNKDELLINMNEFREDKEVFKDLIYHELVHARDPLVRDKKIFGRYEAKVSGKTDYYHKSQQEYIAFLSPMVDVLKRNGIDARQVVDLFNKIKDFNGDEEEFFYSTPRETMKVFSFGEDNYKYGYGRFIALYFRPIKSWSTKPTLWRDMIKKVYNELG